MRKLTEVKRLNHSGGNGGAYLASSPRPFLCMSSSFVRLTILTTHSSFFPLPLFRGAGISGGSLAINYMVEQGVGVNASKASQLLSFCSITSTLAKYAPFM